jgi:galactonate dehydratase
MKITSLEVIAVKKDETRGSRPILCRVTTDEGIYGYGEAQLAIGVGAGPVFEAIKDLGPMLLGMDPLHNEVIWEKLRRSSYWGLSNGVILMAAISAIDIALWDIKGKICNLPLYQLLGGKQREKLRCYASQIHFGWGIDRSDPRCPKVGEPAWFYEAGKNAVAQGFTAIKTGLLFHGFQGERLGFQRTTNHLSRDLMKLAEERLAATREAIGPEVDIILESHATTDANTTIQLAEMARKYDIMLLEEATSPLNPQVMHRIADKIDIPLATGERIFSRWGFLPFLENDSIAVIQPDIGNCGGITEMKKICDMAYVYDVSVQAHVCTSPISYAASLHLETVIPNFFIHEHHIACGEKYMTNIGTHSYLPKNGYIEVSELPGIGVEMSEKSLREARIEIVK